MRTLTVVDVLFGAVAVALLGYLAFAFFRMLKSPSIQKAGMDLVRESLEATRENNALLRELIATNRQLLEKQDGPKS